MIGRWVDFEFDCLPLRSVTRLDVPMDASPAFEQFVLCVKAAIAKHGSHNAYYLHRGRCTFHVTNDSKFGELVFAFEGVVLTDEQDRKTRAADIETRLERESCPWLNEPVVAFFNESVRHALVVEFDRYIEAGDLRKTEERIAAIESESDSAGGFVGMYL